MRLLNLIESFQCYSTNVLIKEEHWKHLNSFKVSLTKQLKQRPQTPFVFYFKAVNFLNLKLFIFLLQLQLVSYNVLRSVNI